MREFALDQLTNNIPPERAEEYANSIVSQRDIQRVFTFYQWFVNLYDKCERCETDKHRRAVLVSLGIVYYLRLNSKYRAECQEFLDKFGRQFYEVKFIDVFEAELEWFIEKVELPSSIAKTKALKENVFATIVCTVTRTPLIIVGDPGSSKTLSFNIVIANLKGKESVNETFRKTGIFFSLDPHFYQCSRRTTSSEVTKIFKRAINRQRSFAQIPLPVYCVVFMDEAGLPEENLESLKVLHYYLDTKEVSFVAISNHVLDAAKTNRAISLFRPPVTREELFQLATECIVSEETDIVPRERKLIDDVCQSYVAVLEDNEFKKLFGLRDFIYFIIYLRRASPQVVDVQLVLRSLERNFNGSERFKDLCDIFFQKSNELPDTRQYRSILDILKEGLKDHPNMAGNQIHSNIQSDVRYKLIIDPSEDDSLVRLLFKHEVLQRESTRLYVCSDFPGDSELKVSTIAQIRHSVAAGHTILMCQTDEIHESFYDLFNQRFRRIEDPEDPEHGTRFYTNIAIGAHSRQCRINPKFQCIIVIKKSDIVNTPAPFLNRFEKYYLTHHSLLETVLTNMPPCLAIIIQLAKRKVADFITCVKSASLYGCTSETLDSLLLHLLPRSGHNYRDAEINQCCKQKCVSVLILETLLELLRKRAGFHITLYSQEEMEVDAHEIFRIVLENPDFKHVYMHMQPEKITAVVDGALRVLHYGPAPTRPDPHLEVYTDSCMVISVLVQWLVAFLCKQLMQLMTPEALVVHRNEVPTVYLQKYLKFQEHFSLRQLLQTLHSDVGTKDIHPTKHLCYTRSSPLIHQLPAEYPGDTINNEEILREYVFSDLGVLKLFKVSLGHTQRKIHKLLTDFVSSQRQLLILIINVQEITLKMINHLRIMIEEAESDSQMQERCEKSFILLLHFPPVMFFKSCYPSLFLDGWSHHYLDSIAHGTLTRMSTIAIVNIKRWFHGCFFTNFSDQSEAFYQDMSTALEGLLLEAIPIMTSKVPLTSNEHGTPVIINAFKGAEILKELLFEVGIGKVLCHKFCSFWKPTVMAEQIERVSRFMYVQESTLNITDSIQSIVTSDFFTFLVYMFTRMHEENIIDILLQESCQTTVKNFILKLLVSLPVPDLAELSIRNNVWRPAPHQLQRFTYASKFPFFKQICGMVENIIEESHEEINQTVNILQDIRLPFRTETASLQPLDFRLEGNVRFQHSTNTLMSRLKEYLQNEESCLAITLKAMDDPESNLWERYFDDFAHCKLHLSPEIPPLTKDILNAYIGFQKSDALTRLAVLHIRTYVSNLDITRITSVLKPISKIKLPTDKSILPVIGPTAAQIPDIPSMDSRTSIFRMFPNLATLIVNILFDSISSIDATDHEVLRQWYTSYTGVVSMPSVAKDIISNLTLRNDEARLNIMHATHLVRQCCGSVERGFDTFKALSSKCFGEGLKQRNVYPCLSEVAETTLEVTSATRGAKCSCQTSLMEGLFSYFFSNHRTQFSRDDCRYFLQLVNQQYSTYPSLVSEEKPVHPLDGCTRINVLKLYLSRILDYSENDLLQYNPQMRKMVGSIIVSQTSLGSPGPYIPTFYQLPEMRSVIQQCSASKNALMQQPLAHLYFLAVLDNLYSRADPSNVYLVRLSSSITELLQKDSTTTAEKVLLLIEKQAVVQIFIQQIATFFDPEDPEKLHSLCSTRLFSDINPLLNDEAMGGSKTFISGHALVLALFIQKQLNSPRKLMLHLMDNQSTLIKTINCLKPLQTLAQHKVNNEAHLFPFIMSKRDTSDVHNFYLEIYAAMAAVHNSKGSEKCVREFVSLVQRSRESEDKLKLTTAPNSSTIEKSRAMRMLLWLCAYFKFFCIRKHHSKILAEVIRVKLPGILEPQYIRLLECFIYPKYMIHQSANQPPLQLSGRQIMRWHVGKRDSLFELFNPGNSKQDESDVQLRHAIANMVAVVLALPPRSNHLWYHMFHPNGLCNTYVSGFMLKRKLNEGGYHYDCGVELGTDGQYGRPAYLSHATRGTLSLHSLYLILWANFSAFSVALLTQPDAQNNISGPVISPWQPVRNYCVAQLRTVWLHMNTNMQFSYEKQSFFIMQCMHTLLKVSINEPHLLRKGLFETLTELDDYEKMWHNRIFLPSSIDIDDKLSQYCQLEENLLFRELRNLEARYSHTPSMEELSHTLLSQPDIGGRSNSLYVIFRFVVQYHRLVTGGNILPKLIEFYKWIHNELAHIVTYNYAKQHSIGEIINKAAERWNGILTMYEEVKDGYNKYVTAIGFSIGAGVCGQEGTISIIRDKTKLLHFLSETDEGEGNDWIYNVIADIVRFHNSFLTDIYHVITDCPENSGLRCFFPDQLEDYVYLNEVCDNVMIIGKTERCHGVDEQLQIVYSRYLQPLERQQGACCFDLQLLQNDVITAYLAGKPRIHFGPQHIKEFRIPFQFSKIQPSNSLTLESTDTDLSVLSECFKDLSGLRLQLDDKYLKTLESEFHTADHHTLVKVMRGLRITVDHLTKSSQFRNKDESLYEMSVPQFLLAVYRKQTTEEDIMQEIGIKQPDLSAGQLTCFYTLKLPYLYSTLKQFVQWIKDGIYDFCQLPLVMKKHFDSQDECLLDCIQSQYTGTADVLLKEMKSLAEVLVHSESDLRKTISDIMQKPIMKYLEEFNMYGEEELAKFIPDSVHCQHYVALRVTLRRQISKLILKRSTLAHEHGVSENQWKEKIDDLWMEDKLKHLMDAAASQTERKEKQPNIDPVKRQYGFPQRGEKPEPFLFIDTNPEDDESTSDECQSSCDVQSDDQKLREVAKRLTTTDIEKLLQVWNLKEYVESFSENGVDGTLLLACTRNDLKEIGVKKSFHLTKIYTKFREYLASV